MKFKESIFGYDFNISESVSSFKVKSALGLENESTLLDTGAVTGTKYLLNGINANLATMLRKVEAYLEFWIEAISHTEPTANRKLYPAEVFKAGLESKGFQRQLVDGGGVPGRFALLRSDM